MQTLKIQLRKSTLLAICAFWARVFDDLHCSLWILSEKNNNNNNNCFAVYTGRREVITKEEGDGGGNEAKIANSIIPHPLIHFITYILFDY